MKDIQLRSQSADDTLEIGICLGRVLCSGDIVALWGELGAGKTLLTRGIARGLGVPRQIPVTSPTFTLINEYDGRLHLYHLDLYRVSHPDELETLPWREVLFSDAVSVIEWPERLWDLLPEHRWDIRIEVSDDEQRELRLEYLGPEAIQRLSALEKRLKKR